MLFLNNHIFIYFISLGFIFADFDTAVIAKTYNISFASITNNDRNEIFSIQSGYDYNRFHSKSLDYPKSTEVSFWYYLPQDIELGLQYDKSMLYNSDTGRKLYHVRTGIFSIYYHFKNNKLPVNLKIGGFYGELDVEGDGLLDISEFKEKSTAYGLSIYKKMLNTKYLDISPYIDFHIIYNTNHTIIDENLDVSTNRYIKSSSGIVLSLKRLQFTPYISCNNGDWVSGWGMSLLFNKY